jgi:hypothetical protein
MDSVMFDYDPSKINDPKYFHIFIDIYYQSEILPIDFDSDIENALRKNGYNDDPIVYTKRDIETRSNPIIIDLIDCNNGRYKQVSGCLVIKHIETKYKPYTSIVLDNNHESIIIDFRAYHQSCKIEELKNEINELKNEINELKNEINELKQ